MLSELRCRVMMEDSSSVRGQDKGKMVHPAKGDTMTTPPLRQDATHQPDRRHTVPRKTLEIYMLVPPHYLCST